MAVDKGIIELEKTLTELSETLADESGVFFDFSHYDDPSPVLDALAGAETRVKEAEAEAAKYTAFQELFGCQAHTFKSFEKANACFKHVNTLWNMVSQWSELEGQWSTGSFTAIDVEAMSRDVQLYAKESYQMNRKKGNKITEKLKDQTLRYVERTLCALPLLYCDYSAPTTLCARCPYCTAATTVRLL